MIEFRVLRIGILSLLLGGAIGCTQLFNVSETKQIALLTKAKLEEKNFARPVSVSGTVGKRIAFLDSGAYQIADETGSIWIFTKEELPEKGTILQVKGKLERKSIPIADRELGEIYILEQERSLSENVEAR